jgi:hypothetical protein
VVTTKRRPAAPRTPARKSSRGSATHARKKPTSKAPPSIMRTHAADLWAVGLVTLGILLALALWGQQLGPVGHGVDTGLAYMVGWVRTLVPLIVAGAGVVLLLERDRPDPLRTGLGAALGLIGICGLGELAKHTPTFTDTASIKVAGGWVGALVGRPLHVGLGSAGAAVLLVAVVIVAALIATGVRRPPPHSPNQNPNQNPNPRSRPSPNRWPGRSPCRPPPHPGPVRTGSCPRSPSSRPPSNCATTSASSTRPGKRWWLPWPPMAWPPACSVAR